MCFRMRAVFSSNIELFDMFSCLNCASVQPMKKREIVSF